MQNWNRLSYNKVIVTSGLVISILGGLLAAGCTVDGKKSDTVKATSTPQPTATLPLATEALPTATSTIEPEPTEEDTIQELEVCHQVLNTFEYYQLMNNGADIDPLGAYYVYTPNKDSQLGILSGKKIIDGYPDGDYQFIAEQEAAGTGIQVCYTQMPDGSIGKYPGTAFVPSHYRSTANVVTTPRNQFAGLRASNRAFSSKPGRF